GAFLLEDYFAGRGLRDHVKITVTGYMGAPVPVAKEVSDALLAHLTARGITFVPKRTVCRLDTAGKVAEFAEGEGIPYDLFIGIPVHRVPAVVAGSGLAPDGWIPVEKTNLATHFDGVYAIGDVAAAYTAKAGVFAERAARVVADDITARLRGTSPPPPYDGAGECFIEVGRGEVGKVHANFLSGPKPTGVLVGPSAALAAEKAEFARTRRRRWFSGLDGSREQVSAGARAYVAVVSLPVLFPFGTIDTATVRCTDAAHHRRRVTIDHRPLAGVTSAMLLDWFTHLGGTILCGGVITDRYLAWHPID